MTGPVVRGPGRHRRARRRRRLPPGEGGRGLLRRQEAPTTGDPVLLERLVQNLVENAVRHNVPEGGWVRVTAAPAATAGRG